MKTKEELEQIKTWKYKTFDYKNDWLKNEKKIYLVFLKLDRS